MSNNWFISRKILDPIPTINRSWIFSCHFPMNHRFESRETSVIGALGCIFVQNITKEGFQYKPLLFFLFCDLDFINFLVIFGGIHEYFARKLENLGWYSWNAKNQKNIETHLVPRLGPRDSATASTPRFARSRGLN